jgi:hypothetical protein
MLAWGDEDAGDRVLKLAVARHHFESRAIPERAAYDATSSHFTPESSKSIGETG